VRKKKSSALAASICFFAKRCLVWRFDFVSIPQKMAFVFAGKASLAL
jgi:hypothetical protein